MSDSEDGLLVEAGSPVAICKAIQTLARDHELAARMKSSALKKFEQLAQCSFGDEI